VHDENRAETGAQQKLSIRCQRLICFTEGGNVETRFGYHYFPLKFGAALFGQFTSKLDQPMSALPLIADMCGAIADVRFGPIADIFGVLEFALKKPSPSGPRLVVSSLSGTEES
jgi:hypothetical protein